MEAEDGDEQRCGHGNDEEEGRRGGIGPAHDCADAFERTRDLVQRVLDLERDALHILHTCLQPLHQCPLQLLVLQHHDLLGVSKFLCAWVDVMLGALSDDQSQTSDQP